MVWCGEFYVVAAGGEFGENSGGEAVEVFWSVCCCWFVVWFDGDWWCGVVDDDAVVRAVSMLCKDSYSRIDCQGLVGEVEVEIAEVVVSFLCGGYDDDFGVCSACCGWVVKAEFVGGGELFKEFCESTVVLCVEAVGEW